MELEGFQKCYVIHEENDENSEDDKDFTKKNHFHGKNEQDDDIIDIYDIKNEETETDEDDDPLDPEIEPLFQCRICEEYFPDANELEAHKAFDCLPCDFCDMVFGSEEWLTNHVQNVHNYDVMTYTIDE